jgi:phage baseplate assembly protein W
MALNIKSLKPRGDGTTLVDSKDTYADLALDFSMDSPGGSNQLFAKSTKKDLKRSTDYEAISNSFTNIFNTSPGQKILNPSFGSDLRYYLFQPVNEETGKLIGDVILKSIKLYEPRVKIKDIMVTARPDQNEYQIDIYCLIPSLQNKSFKYNGTLTDQGVTSSY